MSTQNKKNKQIKQKINTKIEKIENVEFRDALKFLFSKYLINFASTGKIYKPCDILDNISPEFKSNSWPIARHTNDNGVRVLLYAWNFNKKNSNRVRVHIVASDFGVSDGSDTSKSAEEKQRLSLTNFNSLEFFDDYHEALLTATNLSDSTLECMARGAEDDQEDEEESSGEDNVKPKSLPIAKSLSSSKPAPYLNAIKRPVAVKGPPSVPFEMRTEESHVDILDENDEIESAIAFLYQIKTREKEIRSDVEEIDARILHLRVQIASLEVEKSEKKSEITKMKNEALSRFPR